MAIVSLNGIGIYPDTSDLNWTDTGGQNQTFDGAADLMGPILHVPTTGTISKVHYRIATATSAVMTLRIELRTVDATTGLPNAAGTLYGSSTSITVANPTSGYKTAAVNCTGATAGDLVAVVFDLSAFTSGSFILQGASMGGAEGATSGFPLGAANTTGATAVTTFQNNSIALEYGTDTFYPLERNCVVGQISAVTVTNSGTTRRGNIFRCPAPMRAVGMFIWGDLDGDCLLRLRKASDDSILGTATIDKDIRGTTGRMSAQVFFDARATATLAAATDYYALIEGNSATSSKVYGLSNIPTQAQQDQLAGGQNCYAVNYSGSYGTDINGRLAIGIMFDGIDDGSGVFLGGSNVVLGG